jgi:hypothetical protein
MYCLVEMPESAGIASTKVAGMLKTRLSGKLPAPAAPTAEKLKPLAAVPRSRTEAQQMGARAKQARKKAEEDKVKKKVTDSMAANAAKAGFGKPKPQNPEDLKPLRGPTPKKQTTAQKGNDLLKQLQAEGKAQKTAPAKPTPATPAAGKAQKATTGKTPSTVPGPAAGDWRTRFSGRTPQLDFELNKLQQAIDKLPPEQQAFWNAQVNKQMNAKLAGRNGTPYPAAKTDKSLVSQAKAWQDLINNGPPKELMNRIGEKRPAPKGMMPDVTSSGQRKWISPDDGLKYSSGTKEGVWRQNRVAKTDTLRRLPDITEFRKEQQAKGGEWPTQKLSPRPGLPKTVDEVINGLSQKEKNQIVFNGLDATGNEGLKLRQYYDANPKEKEARLREVVQRWHDQGGRSGVSGKPVALPGMEPKAGEERSSVDHFQPISTNRAAALPAADMRRIADNYKNFLVAEEGPNSQRQARSWDSWLDKQEGGGAKKPPAKTPTPKSSNKGEKEKASATPPVKGQPSAAPKSSGVEKIQKIADDQKLERLRAQEEEYKKRWGETIGKGSKENTERASATWNMVKKEYEDFKKEYDDKYNRPVARSPKELMAQESKRVRDRIEDRISSGQTYSKEVNAQIQADGERKYAPFRKLSNDELASLELYGENKVKYYMDVNKFLRTGSMEGVPAERQQIVRDIVSNLNSTLNKLPASEETSFMRAVSGAGAKNLANLKVGDIIEDKGFGSYTTPGRVRTLDQFYNPNAPNAAMRVTSRNARNVAPVMPFEREEEHMLRPGTRLRVVQIIGADDPNAERSRKVGKIPTYIFEEVE